MREDVCVCVAARRLGRPVKWIEDRAENFLAAGHARDEVLDVEAAVTDDGTILGVRVRMTVDQGAYQLTTLPSTVYATLARVLFPNAYRIRDYSFETTIVATNKATYVAYRGPWESETWARERLLDVIAAELGLEPVEVRAAQPAPGGRAPVEDGHRSDARVRHRARDARAGRRASPTSRRSAREQAAAVRAGRYLGIGVATYIEASPGPPDYSAALGASASPRSAQSADVRARARRHGQRLHEPAAARPGSRDDAGAARGRRPGHRPRAGPRRARRHRRHPVQPGGHGREPGRDARQRRRRRRGRRPARADDRGVRAAPRGRPG